MWDIIKGFFESLYGRFNGFLQDTLAIDEKMIGLYNDFIVPLPELIKIVGIVFAGIILVLGVITFVKKMLKLFIVLAVILAIVLLITQLNG
jgi:hypothetical protein